MTDSRALPPSYKKHGQLLVMIAPCLLVLAVFCYLPMGGAVIAFKDYRMDLGIVKSPWCGLDNFVRLFDSEDFPNALRNTFVISVLRLSFGFVAPIILALLLNELRCNRLKKMIQTVTYLPYMFSWVVLGGILLMLFSHRGPFNQALSLAGISPIDFFGEDLWFVILIIATGIWQTIGYGAVIYLAALAGIDPQLYEVSTVDGAGRFQQLLHITLPSLVPTIVVLLILQLGQVMNAGFDQIYNMYNPIVYDVADIIDTYVLRRLQNMDFALATAAGLFKSVVGMVLIFGANFFVNRISRGEQGVW